jgi:hypothetical protein
MSYWVKRLDGPAGHIRFLIKKKEKKRKKEEEEKRIERKKELWTHLCSLTITRLAVNNRSGPARSL